MQQTFIDIDCVVHIKVNSLNKAWKKTGIKSRIMSHLLSFQSPQSPLKLSHPVQEEISLRETLIQRNSAYKYYLSETIRCLG